MITVTKRQLNQVEYLIQQSIQGNHILFDTDTLRRIFWKGAGNDEQLPAVEPLIEDLILQPTLQQKRAFLEKLDRRTFEKLVRTYFNIVENNMLERGKKVCH